MAPPAVKKTGQELEGWRKWVPGWKEMSGELLHIWVRWVISIALCLAIAALGSVARRLVHDPILKAGIRLSEYCAIASLALAELFRVILKVDKFRRARQVAWARHQVTVRRIEGGPNEAQELE